MSKSDFHILNINIHPFNNIANSKLSTGFYIELIFTVNNEDFNYNRFLKHTDILSADKSFYLEHINNTFTFKEAVTYTPTTIGILQELEDLKNNKINSNYRFIPTSYLYRCIQTLDLFWD